MNYSHRLHLLGLLLLSVPTLAECATITLTELPHGNTALTDYRIDAIYATPGEWRYEPATGPGLTSLAYILFEHDKGDGTTYNGGCDMWPMTPIVGANNRVPCSGPTGPGERWTGAWCSTKEETSQLFQSFPGTVFSVPSGYGPPSRIELACRGTRGHRRIPMVQSIVTPLPTVCTSTSATLTLRGRVGERLKETTDIRIHCDRTANLRLSIYDGGAVPVGNDGVVRLKFQTNGSDILNVNGTDPQVTVEGELTKSPTTAGTYRGSSVLRVDIL